MSTSVTELPVPGTVTMNPALEGERAESAILAARRFYAFWDTGDAAQLEAAIAPGFGDHTLPPCRT
jgi:hypothetical protein